MPSFIPTLFCKPPTVYPDNSDQPERPCLKKNGHLTRSCGTTRKARIACLAVFIVCWLLLVIGLITAPVIREALASRNCSSLTNSASDNTACVNNNGGN